MAEALVETKQIRKYFLSGKKGVLETIFRKVPPLVKAVDDVDISINHNEIVALVGESGCGKTTLGRLLTTLDRPTSGGLLFDGLEVTDSNIKEVRRQVQMVFQNPVESLDPRMTLRAIVREPLERLDLSDDEKDSMLEGALGAVGLDVDTFLYRRPSELSGGQRQRIAVARAIVGRPRFVMLDEPTSALDVSVQAQVLNLLLKLQRERGFAYLLITHNIAVARFVSDRVAIMYAGKVVEMGPTPDTLKSPKHPYTQALLKSVPTVDNREIVPAAGEVPSLVNLPSGCRYHPRCPYAMDVCRNQEPPLKTHENGKVACWLY